jgi:hypothetical protein
MSIDTIMYCVTYISVFLYVCITSNKSTLINITNVTIFKIIILLVEVTSLFPLLLYFHFLLTIFHTTNNQHNKKIQLKQTGFKQSKSSFSGRLFTKFDLSICLEERNRRVDLNRSNNWKEGEFLEFPVRFFIPNFVMLYETNIQTIIHDWTAVVRMLLTRWHPDPNLEFTRFCNSKSTLEHWRNSKIQSLPPGWNECNVFPILVILVIIT